MFQRTGHPRRWAGPEWLPAALLLIMLVVTTWTAIVGVRTIRNQRLDAVVLDLAARQRTLNEQYLKRVLLSARGLGAGLESTERLFLDTALALGEGGEAVFNIDTGETINLPHSTLPELRPSFERQVELMQQQSAAAGEWLALPPNDPGRAAGLIELQALNDELHLETNQTVKAIDQYESAKVSTALTWSLASAGAMVLMYGGLFWMNRRLLSSTRSHRRSEAHLNAVVASVVDGIITIDSRGKIESFSPSAEKIFGYAAVEAIGQNVKMLMPEPYHSQHDGYLAQYQRTGRAKVIGVGREVVGRRKDGSTFPLDLAVSRMRHGDRGMFVGITRDITQRKQAEAELREAMETAERANQAKSQFLATMSHELRTPLNSVIGFSNILLKNKAGNLGHSDLTYLERISSNGKHLLSLINDVLDLSKIEAGRMDVQIETVSLPEVIEKVAEQLQGQAREASVELAVELPPAMAPVEADGQRLAQILINLVGNALKFTPVGGTVVIRGVADGDDDRPLRIDIADSGCGIAADKLKSIFRPFRQADGSTSRQYGGTGLGLSISRSLSRLMDFDIAVASLVDRGSTFSIMLAADAPAPIHKTPGRISTPDDDGPERRPFQNVELPQSATGKVVLVVDDDADSRLVLEKYLEDYGCRVIAVDSADRGIEVARALQPDLITLDLMMPEVNGWTALNRLKQDPLTREIPVVIASILASENEGRLVSAVNFIDKPMEREQLHRVLEQSLETRDCDVLIVEDDPDTRQILVDLVTEFGAPVRTATNGEDALNQLESFRPGVILLDLMMPVMDGCSFIKAIRQDPRHAQLPVVVVTAQDLSRDERQLLESETESIVPKGSVLAEGVRQALTSVLGGKGS